MTDYMNDLIDLESIKIREARMDDIRKIYSIEEKSFDERDLYPIELLKFYLNISPKTFLVAEISGEVIGYVIAVVRRGYIGHIVSIAVEPSFRQKGVGRMLMNKIEETLESLGCIILRLEVSEKNFAARFLYLNLGFLEAYTIPNYYCNGCSAIVMFKLKK
ncbi:MAG: N-acetyltransferase [Candidatus Methanomethylicia archaeon]